VKYRDHVEFKNSTPSRYGPSIREVTGWLFDETEETLHIIYDRSVNPQLHEQRDSGLIILKMNIVERKVLEG
jgi:hypothetical protein